MYVLAELILGRILSCASVHAVGQPLRAQHLRLDCQTVLAKCGCAAMPAQP